MSSLRHLLPMRPRPFEGEATPGFLMRVAAANGFMSVPQLLTSLKHRQQSAFDELTDRLCLTSAERNALYGALPARWGLDALPSGLTVSDFNHDYRRWCPPCLKDSGFILGQWTLKLACVCTKHGVWLREQCAVCKRTGTWSEVDHLRCACLANLARGPVEHAEALHVMLQKVLNGEADASCATLGEFANLLPPQAHRVVRYLGQFASQLRPGHPGQIACAHHLTTAKILVVGTTALMSSWPSGVHRLMAALQASAPSSPSIRQTFSPLYRVLYRELSDPSAQFLRDAFESYLHEHWWGLVCRRNKLMRAHTISAHPRLTLPQAAAATGVPTSVVRHLLQAELIEAATTLLPSGRASQTVHVDELSDIKAATAGSHSLKEAARLLALPESRVRMLISANLITPLISRRLNRKASAWLIGKAEIERLHVQPTRAKSCAEMVLMRDVLKFWRLKEGDAVAVVMAVIERQLSVMACPHHKIPIGLAPLEVLETKQWLVRRRLDSGEGLSVDQAAKELGLKQEVGYDLVRLGLLATVDAGLLGRRVMAPDLAAFRVAYVSLAELASETKRSPRALLARLSVLPVCGPNIDGARQYFYRRTEVASLLVSDPHVLLRR